MIPSLCEQQQIASTLDEIDELRQNQRKAIALTRQMIPALFYEMFGNERDFPRVSLETSAEIFGGSTPARKNNEYWNGHISWITPTDLKQHKTGINLNVSSKKQITEVGQKESNLKILPPGTVLFSSRAKIGKVGITQVPVTTNQGFVNFVPKNNICSIFLAIALWMKRDEISNLSKSTTFKEVSRKNIKKFKLLIP
ncbi:MAG: restriction endonuclease subunit S, partial [Candidatus Neptunochlamydia sp.]|nr:restriction endonuclease subunit S [Candidatus Neptunochlamydia sp.]